MHLRALGPRMKCGTSHRSDHAKWQGDDKERHPDAVARPLQHHTVAFLAGLDHPFRRREGAIFATQTGTLATASLPP